jgi:hypothetical protein
MNSLLIKKYKEIKWFQLRHVSFVSVLLVKQLTNKGSVGDVIKVRGGYARNILIPQKIAGRIYLF